MAAIKGTAHPPTGFALLEILVVMLIISILAGAVILSTGSASSRRIGAEAERLQEAAQMAADEAVFQKTEMGMTLSKRGYRFMRFDIASGQWQPLNIKALGIYMLPDDMQMALTENNEALNLPDTLQANGMKPYVVFSSSGEMTAFSLTLFSPFANAKALLTTDGIAPISVQNENGS